MAFDAPTKSSNKVTLSNAIISSVQQLTLNEKRLLMLAVSKLDSRAASLPTDQIKVTAAEFESTFGLLPKQGYKELLNASESVLKKVIVFRRPGPKAMQVTSYPWLSKSDYIEGEGWVALKFNPEIAPCLVDLKEQFTSYRMHQIGRLRSLYSWRLLEHFEMWKSTGQWDVSIEEFHAVMETPPAYAKNFAKVRIWVIDPAIKELEEKDGWKVSWYAHKRGRQTSALTFNFERVQPELPLQDGE